MVALTKTISGFLYQSDGSLNGWTGPPQWTSAGEPTYVCFDPLPLALLSPLDSECRDGIRESQLYIESGVWHLFYSGGDGTNGWVSYHATSIDRGLSWTRQGMMSDGRNGEVSGTYPAVDLGWIEKRGTTYYKHRINAAGTFVAPNNGLPLGNYTWGIWSSTDLVTWTAVRAMPADASGWGAGTRYCGSVILSGGTYYGFAGGGNSEAVGLTTSTTPGGVYTSVATALLTGWFDNYGPENPKVFFSPTLNVWCMLCNAYVNPGGWNDRNLVFVSSSFTDWTASKGYFLQRASPMDSSQAIGVMTHVTGPDGVLIYDTATGNIPVIYDGDPRRFGNPPDTTHGWHLGRKLKSAVLEPSANCLRYTGSADTTARSLSRSLAHTDITIELAAEAVTVNAGGGSLTVEYRSDGAGNCYRARLTSASQWILYRVAGGVETQIASYASAAMVFDTTHMLHRLKVSVVGNTHYLSLDGEKTVVFTDGSPIASGATIALTGLGLNCDVRCLSARTSDTVTIQGLHNGEGCIVRGYGGLPAGAAVANASGVATFTHAHSPLWSLDIGGTDYTPSGGIWGGDTLTFSGITSGPTSFTRVVV